MRCRSETLSAWRVILLVIVGSVVCVDARIWNEADLFPLDINEQCNGDGSVTLNIKNVQIPLTVYAYRTDGPEGTEICHYESISPTNSASVTAPKSCLSNGKYNFRIFKQLSAEDAKKVVTYSSEMMTFYLYDVDCSGRPARVQMRKTDPTVTKISFPSSFTIGGTKYISRTSFNGNYVTEGDLGNSVKIEIMGNNVFGSQSHLVNCVLQVRQKSSGAYIEPIKILENSCVKTPDYKSMDFKNSYNQYSGYKIEFKAFALKSLLPYDIYCEACLDCAQVTCST